MKKWIRVKLLKSSDETSKATQDVIAERKRQVEVEGWTPEHDDKHDSCELATAAVCYAICADSKQVSKLNYDGARLWPGRWVFKPKSYRANLVTAAALIIAEIERIDRTTPSAKEPT